MAVTQYIGARYVPLIADPIEWDSRKSYEPLTIVLYQGASYTSRQAVPVGININNTEYWALTGNYNAQVEQYRQEVLTFNNRISENTEAIAENAADITKLNDDLNDEVTARINGDSSLQDSIDDINNELDDLLNGGSIYHYFSGSNAVIIGDSYAYGTGCSDHLDGDTKRFSSLLCSALNATEFNFSVGSTGFCDPGSAGQNMTFANQVQTALDSMTQTQIANTHLVLIAGGINDFNEGATYTGTDMTNATASACSIADTGFPNALIVVVPMLFKGAGANPRLLNFENAIVNGVNGTSRHRRCVVIRGAWTWNFGMASHYNSDKLHPNDIGYRNIAARIYERILGGDAYENRMIGFDFESGYGGSVDQGTYLELHNGVINMYGNYVSGTLPANVETKIATAKIAAPNQPAYGLLCKSGNAIGTWEITTSGAIYAKATSPVTDFYLSPQCWIPKGVM